MSNAPIFCDADNVEQFYEFVKDDNSGGSEGVLAPPPPVPSNFYPDILHRLMMTTSVCPQLQESIWNGGGWQLHAGGYVNTAEDPYINGYCPPGGLLPFYQEQAQVNSTSNNICPVKSENEDESFKQLREFIINRRKRLLALDHNEQANTSASAQPAQYQHAQLRTAQRFDWAEDVENSERNARQQSTDSSGSEGIFYHRLSPSDATWGMDKSKYIRNYQHDEDEQKNAATNRKTPTPTTKGKINDSDDRKMRANAREQRLRKDKRNTGGYRMAKSAILDAIKTNKKSTTPPIKTSHENLEQNMLKNSSPSTKEKYDSDPQETAFASDRFPICTQDDFYSPDDKFWDDDSHTDESDTKTGTIPLFDAASYKLSPTTTEEKFSDEYSIIDESNPQRSSPYVESRVYNKSEPCTEDTSLEEESSYPQTRQSPFIDEAESFVKTQPHPQITKTPFVEARSSKMPQLAIDENFWYRYMTTRSSSYTESRSYEESQLDTEEKSLEEVIQPHSGNSSFTETGSFINIEPCTQEDSYPQTTQSPCIEATSSKMSQSAADKKSWDSYSSTYESDPQRSSSYVEPRSFKKSPPHTEETILEEESYPQTTKTQFVQANRRSQPYAEEKSLEEESHPPTRKPATFKKFQSFPKTQSSSDGKYKTASSTRHSSTSSDGSIEEDAKPLYKGHQLLGDSQFVRFSRQILEERVFRNAISYCVSGQKIQGLYNMVVNREFTLHNRVIVMIGTNDLKNNSSLTLMKKSYTKLLDLLKESVDRIVLITIPPIQYMTDSVQHWRTFEGFNKFILEQHNGKQVFVVDFAQHLVGYGGSSGCSEYFEQMYASNPSKKDLVHLNKKGFLLLKFLLDVHYFCSAY